MPLATAAKQRVGERCRECALTPLKVSVPTEASPVAMPVARFDHDAGRRSRELDARGAIADDRVVAGATLEGVEGAEQPAGLAGARESGSDVGVREIGAVDDLDVDQGVGADGGVARHRSHVGRQRGEIDRDAAGGVHVLRAIVPARPVDRVVARSAAEELHKRVRAAGQDIVMRRADHAFDADQRVGAAIAVLRDAASPG